MYLHSESKYDAIVKNSIKGKKVKSFKRFLLGYYLYKNKTNMLLLLLKKIPVIQFELPNRNDNIFGAFSLYNSEYPILSPMAGNVVIECSYIRKQISSFMISIFLAYNVYLYFSYGVV